ncbi:4-alpha-glucanotransferase [Glaciecola sp. HTCC2999]|uniref:4-alpha-glucanotransferase n=1 Tax=Glaciecola sp. HTCC2999 TaxID=455436 RepID=UPI0000E0E999|nr:4-alpha-glucanotransferase [Glaciecola sp. HTCC2999]
MTQSIIDTLVQMRGIETSFVDAWGKPATVADGTKEKILGVMGYDVENIDVLEAQMHEQVSDVWMTPLNPVQVIRDDEQVQIPVRLPIELVTETVCFTLTFEDKDSHVFTTQLIEHELVNATEVDGAEFQEYIIMLDVNMPHGYHTLTLAMEDGDVIGQGRIIQAPKACFTPDAITQGKKIWGLSIQLYCVRSEKNWGIGDFSDLTVLINRAADQGADFVGLNPIHALYPNNPNSCSPYSPSSRKWLNHLYINVSAVPGYDQPSIQAMVNDADFQAQLTHTRAIEYVDYNAVSALKMPVLKALFELNSSNIELQKALDIFIDAGGESLQTLMRYDALQAHLKSTDQDYWGWPVFPEALQTADLPAVDEFAQAHADEVRFYGFLQYLAAEQFEAASAQANARNMIIGLYRDLAVGVSEGSAEIWGAKDLYVTDASVGAPPDILGPLGQNWGLPPMDPEQLYQQGYQPIIDLFSSNMQHSGALRIDHAMALLRLWWVTKGDHADKGGYVYYPVDDLLGILALESHRHQTLIIGEDLGTVPEEIRQKLADNGVYSYRVFFFEQAKDGGFYSPSHYPVQSMSTLTIHDFPTLIGYWHCNDLALGKELGLYPTDEILQPLYDSRHDNKQQILNTLHGHGAISDNIARSVEHVGMTQELNYGMQVHMATGSSALLSLQLEDWLQMDKPVNIPGTFEEYPNWKRKLSHNLEDIFTLPEVLRLSQRINSARRDASTT